MITFSTQALFSSAGSAISVDVGAWYCFYSHEILVNSINTFYWGQTEEDEFNILIYDKADEYGFSVREADVEKY